jgi:hypothetical protein
MSEHIYIYIDVNYAYIIMQKALQKTNDTEVWLKNRKTNRKDFLNTIDISYFIFGHLLFNTRY